jgi:hypothetical protein
MAGLEAGSFLRGPKVCGYLSAARVPRPAIYKAGKEETEKKNEMRVKRSRQSKK